MKTRIYSEKQSDNSFKWYWNEIADGDSGEIIQTWGPFESRAKCRLNRMERIERIARAA